MDANEKSFLEQKYLDMIPLFRDQRAELLKTCCDHKDVRQYLEEQTEGHAEVKEFAMAGRSNVGKSSLINAILSGKGRHYGSTAATRKSQGALALTSKTPGKTNRLQFYSLPGIKASLVDCPGYGFARASHTEKENWRRFMEMYLRQSQFLHRVILLVDIEVGLMESDKMLISMLSDSHRPFMIVMTKADKIKDVEIGKQLQ
jgi:GTP-binding protein